MSYLTSTQYDRIINLPISLPQTELRKQHYLQVCTLLVAQGQRLEIGYLSVHLFRILTPGVTPQFADSSLGLVSVGLMASSMFSSALGLVSISEPGCASWNADQPVVITAPGVYNVQVLNNTTNVDLSVVVTGSARYYY
jgi:hypothetical protein